MNTFGRIFRISIFGESHGPVVGVLIDGCPAGLGLTEDELMPDLERRRSGKKGTTARKESDRPTIKSGLFNGRTTGAPILIEFENNDVNPEHYEKIKDTPRPGHADLTANKKFHGFNDYRGGGHFSGRLTVGIVAAGAIAKKLIAPAKIHAELKEAGGSKEIEKSINQTMAKGDSVGGIIECRIEKVPSGLGEPFFDSVESLVSHIVFSIPAVKGVEFGAGFGSAKMKGSECNDAIVDVDGKTATNNAGGVNGGLTNGNVIVFRVAVKPTSSISAAGSTVDLRTNEQTKIVVEGRHDSCIALRMPVIVEAAAAIVLADLMLLEQIITRAEKRG